MRPEVLKVALPPDSVALPIVLPPSVKETTPVGEPIPETAAVKVTGCPEISVVGDAISVVVVTAGGAAAGVKAKSVAE